MNVLYSLFLMPAFIMWHLDKFPSFLQRVCARTCVKGRGGGWERERERDVRPASIMIERATVAAAHRGVSSTCWDARSSSSSHLCLSLEEDSGAVRC